MKELSYNGFLKRYVRDLSQGNTCSIYKLAREAEHDNPRLKEPLYLYAVSSGKKEELMNAVKNSPLKAEYCALETLSELPERYSRIYTSYLAERDRYKTQDNIVSLIQKKVCHLQNQKGISTYRICKDLHLNPGNINCWLKNGDCKKVSLSTARSVLDYVQNSQTRGI